ncbi:hypothetical protein AM1BK_48690 [Neobacillus kokaensis]|uniref:Uncharacterized protein n=1 Tax=Neobacillus kokaensis TaxID=2759023 RepID=A0ABQ3NBM6_9BACI|nr:hypothetical protein AM1BK_48690 [Neobacillus kokaensis]
MKNRYVYRECYILPKMLFTMLGLNRMRFPKLGENIKLLGDAYGKIHKKGRSI